MGDDSLLFKNKYRIPSARMKGWDYSTPGWYFITICTRDKRCLFGEVIHNGV
jgi:putative transposase